ncbi:epoxide hydrolase family protein [Paradevosia shaoguanensis]|uniref:Epoxide hydrolase n=1 Tax=Paradevosia shaoguanensis TaxID=1335043 RepID=A0AA41QQK4_9HYPH|nr:epoxide hydrolase family protein [Paradevosia shaoguanensis]MCF1744039.1 epoxide hydrolase [Paradevosia shaoguanensis]MCI0128522.1 epoxide hydrolase [Paradevosia shaoguanensis]
MFDSRRDLLALVGAGIFSSGFALRTHGEVEMPNDQITPFTVAISDAQIADLKERLTMARWPTQVATDWSHGQPVAFIRELAEQWLKDFDWRTHEAALNAYPQFTTVIDGQTIHFLHIKSPEPNAFPLILTHGWPSSVLEFLDVIGPLSDPRRHGLDPALAFDLVIPSLPGFGWSVPLSGPGWDAARAAEAWDVLMKRLGYDRYGAQGGDGGALVGRELGILAPEGLVGTHLQQIFAFPSGAPGEMESLTPFEMAGFANLEKFQKYAGYSDIQSKRPATLGYGLVDSPVGLLAWNAELFFGFEGEQPYDRDRYLAQVSIYWFTATGSSAAEFYLENARTGAGYRELPNTVPTAVAVFPDDFRSVRAFAARSTTDIAQWTEMPRGGHFAASDAPDLLVADMRKFFGALR